MFDKVPYWARLVNWILSSPNSGEYNRRFSEARMVCSQQEVNKLKMCCLAREYGSGAAQIRSLLGVRVNV